MMIRLLFASLMMTASAAQALEPPLVPGLLATALARPLLEQDPGVAAARAGMEVARQEAGILDQSPYEWTAKALTQRRTVNAGGRYGEWNIGIERGVRLPVKSAADRRLGEATVSEARARYGESVHDSARELMALWLEWLAAEQGHALAQASLTSVQDNLAAVDKRVRAGDASKLDANLARAELAEQRRLENDAKTQASAAWARLSARFPGLGRERVPLPSPLVLDQNDGFWRQRILSESEELKIVEAQVAKAEAQAEREKAGRMPDPTLGVYTASEVGGRERISGVTISIPLPGGLRASRSAKAVAAQEVANHALELKRRQLETEIAGELATARGAYESMQIANEGAKGMQENARLTQRAYTLGEGDLQTLLLARRQAGAAANSALQAQLVALKAWYGLLVDAHLVWDLDRD
ncbi:MAG: TolC family protein [Pseudomonadota bacterium]